MRVGPDYVKPLTLTAVTTGAVCYHFKSECAFGWAIATVNDQTGELAIQSDWGNWSYRWHVGNLGSVGPEATPNTLTMFIADRDPGHCDYLADKLTPRVERERFDMDASVAQARRILCEYRLEQGRQLIEYNEGNAPEDRVDVGTSDPPKHAMDTRKVRHPGLYYREPEEWPLTKRTARSIWDALGEIDAGTDESFVDRFFRIAGHEWVSAEPWEDCLKFTPAASYYHLLYGILPALVEACFARAYPGRHRCQLTMPREAGAGHWRDWHRGHGCQHDDTPIAKKKRKRRARTKAQAVAP